MTKCARSLARQEPVKIPRWSDLEAELAITEHQYLEWQRFVTKWDSIAQALRDLEVETFHKHSDCPPSLISAFDENIQVLSVRLMKAQELSVQLEALYCRLSFKQKSRADRLLRNPVNDLLGSGQIESEGSSQKIGSAYKASTLSQLTTSSPALLREQASRQPELKLLQPRYERATVAGT
jgi:hypothetical protein